VEGPADLRGGPGGDQGGATGVGRETGDLDWKGVRTTNAIAAAVIADQDQLV
jgi:hypothetical protein